MADMTLHEAADRLGVHYMTVYRYVRLGRLEATKAGNVWRVDEDDLASFVDGSVEPRTRDDWCRDLESLMVDGDTVGAWALIEEALVSSFTPEEVHLDLILPTLRSVGERWAAGELDIAQEHLATAVAKRCVSRLSPRFHRRGTSRGTVVVAMGPGEWHQVGAEVLADLLRGERFRVLFLGPNTPPEAVAAAAERAVDLVAVCVGAFQDASPLASVVDAVRAKVPGTTIVVGGPAVGSVEAAQAIGADHGVASLSEAVAVITALV
jgi:MerR family transcriptional regulator, light-induced transcriptional regulator